MLPSLPAALSLALLQPAAPAPVPAPPPAAPAAAPAQPVAQPTPPTLPAEPAAPVEPATPYAQPLAPSPAVAQPSPPANTSNTPLPNDNVAQRPGALLESVTHRRLVFANLYSLSFNILLPYPSGEVTFYLGTNLRPRKNAARTFDWNTAIGYQLTLSAGGADVMTYRLSPLPDRPWFVHRHHFTAMGHGGKHQRLFYSLGGGVMFVLSNVGGVEGEGRLGYVFTRPEKRVKGVVGGQARLTAAFGGVPLLQIGPFIGFMAF